MNDDTRYLLDDLLVQWHYWCRSYRHMCDIGSSAMFKEAKTQRVWDTVAEIVADEIDTGRMAAVDFHVSELEPLHRTALQIQARNLATGKHVWTSARLPTDLAERSAILGEARKLLMSRLVLAGVI